MVFTARAPASSFGPCTGPGGDVPDTLAHRYRLLDLLGQGGMGAVYRAYDRLTGQLVALKRVTTAVQAPLVTASTEDDLRLQLAREFRTLASLRHPHVVSVFDYGFDDQQRPYFTMELLDRPLPLLPFAEELEPHVRVELLLEILQALSYLHRLGVVHRDLKPDNVLVTASRHIKVVDFGIAVALHEKPEDLAGTVPYMAPELLMGGKPSASSDLYAVGVMAYELFAGRHPFGRSSLTRLDQVFRMPDLDAVRAAPGVVALVGRLLAKRPDERPRTAVETLRLLAEASGMPPPRESAEIRESFLSAARFVGRDGELGELLAALSDARAGKGSTWLVGGESGVGKSRLLAELGARALVEQVPVVRGRAVSAAGRPLQVWRDVLRHLVLSTPLDDLEASVLRSLVPDIGALLGRAVLPAPEIEAQSAHERVLRVATAVLARQATPLIVFLEDLHWEGPDSLGLLRRAAQQPNVMIVGTYRDDETPDLPEAVPDARTLRLARLPPAQIAALAESMLGRAARAPGVLELLQRETEGNAFFLVETVRALAADAHRLDEIGARPVPERVAAGSIHRVVERRLARAPEGTRPLLELAAVAGDRVDERMLAAASPAADLGARLTECAHAAVLAVDDGYRFAHHKLREALLARLEPERRRALHREVAAALERAYDDSAPFAAELAHHHAEGGDPARAAPHALVAGAAALANGAAADAIRWLREATRDPAHLPAEDRVRALRLLVEALHVRGQLAEVQPVADRALALVGWPVPGSTFGLVLGTLAQVILHLAYRLLRFPMPRPRRAPELLIEGMRVTTIACVSAVLLDRSPKVAFLMARTFNTTEIFRGTPEYARGAALLRYITRVIGLRRWSERYDREIGALRRELPDGIRPVVAHALGVSYLDEGRWAEALDILQEGASTAQLAGDDLQWMTCLLQIVFLRCLRGEPIRGDLGEVEQVARRAGNEQISTWTHMFRVLLHLRAGLMDAAMAAAADARVSAERAGDSTALVNLAGVQPLLHHYAGDRGTAEALAREGLRTARSHAMLANGGLEGLPTLVLTFHLLGLPREARRACRLLRRMARRFPIARPRALLFEGMVTGDRARARAALAEARRLGMPFEEALALQTLGEAGRADEIFERLDAPFFRSDRPGGRPFAEAFTGASPPAPITITGPP